MDDNVKADPGMETRIQELEAIEAIRALPSAYAHHIAANEAMKIPALFTDDARITVKSADGAIIRQAAGKAEVEGFFATTTQGGTFPLIANQLITVAGKTATGSCVMYNPFNRGAGPAVGILYHDRFACPDGRWLFAERTIISRRDKAASQ